MSTANPTHLGIDAIRRAADVVGEHVPATPLLGHPLLDAFLHEHGTGSVLVKHENVLPTGAFKVRGGINLASTLTDDDRRSGLISCSTGNHAQSVAFAAQLAGTHATIVMPTSAPEVKRAAVEALGARVVSYGPTLAEAGAQARALASDGPRYICPTDPAIILGHATAYLELFSEQPDLDAVYVPIGSGTGAAGACLVRDALAPRCRVVGVQSEAAPAAWRSWSTRTLVSAPCTSRVSGLATAAGFELPQAIMADRLDDFLLVSDDAIGDAMRLMARLAHTLAEGAGAASLAGLMADPRRPDRPDARSAVVCTGGNASAEEIASLGAVAA